MATCQLLEQVSRLRGAARPQRIIGTGFTEWQRLSAWIDQSGAPQASVDIDAYRLNLLDRFDDDESSEEDITF